MSLLEGVFGDDSLTADAHQTLTLIRRETTQAISSDTGSFQKTTAESSPWSGTGVLQPYNRRQRQAVAGEVGGVEEVLVSHQAYLPWEAHPRPGWVLRDELGQEYEQLTAPVNVGGARAYWLLNLGSPTRSLESAYISAGFWVEV